MRSWTTALALLVVCLAACGGDSGDSPPPPEEQVRDAIADVLAADDAERVCGTLVTARFLDEVYGGDRKRCASSPPGANEAEGTPKVESVTVDGDRADAAFVVEDGTAEGTGGTIALAREGETWKLDRYGADYLRSAFGTAIVRVESGALSLPRMRACMERQAATMPEGLLRRFMYEVVQRSPKVRKTTIAIAKRCPDALAVYVANAIAEALADGERDKAFIRCARRELRDSLELTGLAAEALQGNTSRRGTAALQGLASGVAGACG